MLTFLTLSLVFFMPHSFAQSSYVSAPSVQWSKTYTTGYLYEVVQADDASYMAAGGDRLVKVDNSGNILWEKQLPPVLPSDPQQYRYSANDIHALTKTIDGGYALAGHASNRNNSDEETSAAVLIKTDSKGAIQWNKTYGVHSQTWGFSLVQTIDKGYVLAGMAHTIPNSTMSDFSQTDIVLIKTDENGNEQWTQNFGDSQSTDIAFSVIESSDGGFAFAGQTKPGTTYNESYYYIVKTAPLSPTNSPTASSSPSAMPDLSLEILAVIMAILVAAICIVVTKFWNRNSVPSMRNIGRVPIFRFFQVKVKRTHILNFYSAISAHLKQPG